jgi:hypothetical protein
MKKIRICLMLMLFGCSGTPEIIYKKPIEQPGVYASSNLVIKEAGWGWLFWYVPIAFIGMMWAYSEFIKKDNSDSLKKMDSANEKVDTGS